MTGYQSKKAAALDEEGMYLVHQTKYSDIVSDGGLDPRNKFDAQPAQKPVAWVCEGSSSDEKHAIDYQQEDVDAIPIGTMLYATPPQRPWVGLTDDELAGLSASGLALWDLWKAIEAKLREKNT